jgi:lipoprotein NlpD
MKKIGFFSGIGRVAPAIIVAGVLGLAGCASKSPAPVVERGTPSRTAGSDTYTVKGGDTLYSIAREHGLDHRELIALNGIENPDQIAVGRVLRIRRAEPAAPEGAVAMPVSSGVVFAQPIGETPVAGRTPIDANAALKREPKAGKEAYSEQALAAAAQTGGQLALAAAAQEPASEGKPADRPSGVATVEGLSWIWPAGGQVIGTFSGANKGIEIVGKAGDPVIATGNGKVVYSGTGLRGYGKLVIIKHNANFLSAYAHNRNILVKEGESVNQGQRIAEMGDTDADRVKLHFEVRRQGEPVDPLKYLPPR